MKSKVLYQINKRTQIMQSRISTRIVLSFVVIVLVVTTTQFVAAARQNDKGTGKWVELSFTLPAIGNVDQVSEWTYGRLVNLCTLARTTCRLRSAPPRAPYSVSLVPSCRSTRLRESPVGCAPPRRASQRRNIPNEWSPSPRMRRVVSSLW